MKLFSKPQGGTVDINIGNHKINASYLTDVPIEFLNSFIACIENRVPFCVYIDEENQQEILCVVEDMLTITVMEDWEYKNFDSILIDFDAFVKEIIIGVEEYFDDWVKWFMDDDEERLKTRANNLREKLEEAKAIANKLDIEF